MKSDVEELSDVENDGDVRDAIVSDIVSEMEKLTIETPAQEADENQVEGNEETASPPSLAQLYDMFRPIQESAFLCRLPDASSHLQRALNVCREALLCSQSRAMARKWSIWLIGER